MLPGEASSLHSRASRRLRRVGERSSRRGASRRQTCDKRLMYAAPSPSRFLLTGATAPSKTAHAHTRSRRTYAVLTRGASLVAVAAFKAESKIVSAEIPRDKSAPTPGPLPNRRSSDAKTYLYFHMSPGEQAFIQKTGLTLKYRYALSSEEQRYHPLSSTFRERTVSPSGSEPRVPYKCSGFSFITEGTYGSFA